MHLHIQLHHLVHVKGLDTPGNGGPQRVAHKLQRVMVAEKLGVILEDRAFLGLFHVHLHAQQTLFAHLVQELVHHLERVQVARLGEGRAFQRAHEPGNDRFQDADRVGHQQSAGCRAGNDQQLRRLRKNCEVALLHQESADDGSKHNHNSYNGKHVCPPGADVTELPPPQILASMAFRADSSNCASVSS